jgi:hypothetical protein
MRTNAGRRRRRTYANTNTASAQPVWAADSQRYDFLRSPFPGLTSLSRQLHDWQTYEGLVN